MKPVLGSQLRLGHPLARGLVGCWLMNEGSGSKVLDLSGNQGRYFGDLISDVTWKSGKSGHCLHFAGVDDYVKLQLWDGGPKVSFFARVKFEQAIGAVEQICAADSSTSALRTFQFRRSATGKLDFVIFVGDVLRTITGDTTITTGEWWDVAAINDGTNIHIYVNGVEDATPVASGNMDNDAAAFAIGSRPANVNWGVPSEDLEGRVEFLMRWDDALSASEIAQLHLAPFYMFERDPIEVWAAATAGAEEVAVERSWFNLSNRPEKELYPVLG